jgi:toxin ParE1/3/4
MGDYRVSDKADEDLLNIYLYGVAQFGRPKAVEYQLSFERCFELIADNPRMGRLSATIRAGLRRHEHGSHVVLYKEHPDHVLIVTVVHVRSVKGLKL